jgi:HAD superfamily hydrolase (TIGR01549 family)
MIKHRKEGKERTRNAMRPVIILDFDGVILESVDVKTNAFRSLFSFSPYVDDIVRYHLKNGGMSRFEKFRYIYESILHEDLSDIRSHELSEKFSYLVEESVMDAPFVQGAERFLEAAVSRSMLYIVSATPDHELKRIVHKKNISGYFAGVFGSPGKKPDHIHDIMAVQNLSPGDIIFVGDALNDLAAARECGIRFIGRTRPCGECVFKSERDVEYVVADMDELLQYLVGKI